MLYEQLGLNNREAKEIGLDLPVVINEPQKQMLLLF